MQEKADRSPVTEADQAIEAMARTLVRERHPELAALGEEQGAAGAGGSRLIIDPIDGTRNFVRGIPVFATLLAIEAGGEVVAGVVSAPALHARWRAVGRTRGFGDFYQHMLVAEGAGEIAIDPIMHAWEIAALQVIVEEAGGPGDEPHGRTLDSRDESRDVERHAA